VRAGVWRICGPHRGLATVAQSFYLAPQLYGVVAPFCPTAVDVRNIGVEDAAGSLMMRGALGERTGSDELPYRGTVYGQGSCDAALGDAPSVQFHHSTVTGIALLAALEGSALFPGGEHGDRARRLGNGGVDSLRLHDPLGCLPENGVIALDKALECFRDVLEQVPAIGHLHGLWSTLRGGLGVRAAAVPCYDLDLGMAL
jgi:hypothetical protein